MGNKGEEIRGCARRGRCAGGRVPKRRKEGEGSGSGTGTRHEVESRPDAKEEGKAHSAWGRRVQHEVAAMREREAKGPDTDSVRRARREITRHT